MKKVLIVLCLIILPSMAFSQVEDTVRVETPDTAEAYQSADEAVRPPERNRRPPARITGEIGILGEYYSVSGREARRPETSGRVFIRPTLTLLGTFRTSLEIIYSTEGSSARQNIGQFAIHPRWSWGVLHLGDFSHKFSEYSLSGITIRGGGVELTPGLFRFHAVGGQTKRKVENGPDNSVYTQYAYGVKLGVGREESSFFDINVLKVEDDKNSLPVELFQADSLTDTTDADTVPQFGVTPQENFVASANSIVRLFKKRLTLKGEIAGAAYSSNVYSSEELGEEFPSIPSSIFTPRISSRFDYAYRSELTYRQSIFNIKGGYSYIGPGYTSLGLSSNFNDKRTIDTGMGVRFLKGRLMLQGNFQIQNDNVADQKLSTTTRTTYSVNANTRPTNQISIMLSYMNNIMKNDNADSTWIVRDTIVYQDPDTVIVESDSTLYLGEIHNVNSNYSANFMYMFMISNLSQNININYSTQFSEDKNPTRQGNDSQTQNIMLSTMSMLSSIWTVTTSFNYNIIDIESQDKTNRTTIGLQLSNRLFNGKFSNTLGGNYAMSDESDILGINFSSSYSLSRKDSIKLTVKSSMAQASDSSSEDYDELMVRLGYTHKF